MWLMKRRGEKWFGDPTVLKKGNKNCFNNTTLTIILGNIIICIVLLSLWHDPLLVELIYIIKMFRKVHAAGWCRTCINYVIYNYVILKTNLRFKYKFWSIRHYNWFCKLSPKTTIHIWKVYFLNWLYDGYLGQLLGGYYYLGTLIYIFNSQVIKCWITGWLVDKWIRSNVEGRSHCIIWYYFSICLQGLRKTTGNIRLVGLWTKIWTQDFSNTKLQCLTTWLQCSISHLINYIFPTEYN